MRAAWISAKAHRFELAAGVVIGAGLALWGTWLWLRLTALDVPMACIDGWLIDGPATRPECGPRMAPWVAIMGADAEPFFRAMGTLPYVAGLVVATPIVSRELEAGTAQTAWWLNTSRTRWLARQVTALGVPVLLVVGAAAFVAGLLAAQDAAWGISPDQRIGVHGPDVAARTAASFGIALLVGSRVGRTLPAFLTAAAVVGALVAAMALGRSTWLAGLERMVVGVASPDTGEPVLQRGAVATGWGWLSPDGQLSLVEVAGYEPVLLGVTQEAAMRWEPVEVAVYGATALITLLGAFAIVQRRRPL